MPTPIQKNRRRLAVALYLRRRIRRETRRDSSVAPWAGHAKSGAVIVRPAFRQVLLAELAFLTRADLRSRVFRTHSLALNLHRGDARRSACSILP
jgi:hypothetical protein